MIPLSKQSESRSTGAGMALRPCSSMWLGQDAFYGLTILRVTCCLTLGKTLPYFLFPSSVKYFACKK